MNPNIYVPELDYYFYQYWNTRGEIGAYQIPEPTILTNPTIIKSGSFIELLFSETYSEDSYRYLFNTINVSSFSKPIRDRLLITQSVQPYMCESEINDSTGTVNLFSLEDDDFTLLDSLLEYRTTETTDISSIVYSSLTTNLSKLIFLYLDLVINGNYENLNNETPISDSTSIIEVLFEVYVINEAYKRIRSWKITMDNDIINLRPVQDKFEVDETILSELILTLSETPYSELNFFLFRNAELQESDLYTISIDTTSSSTVTIDPSMDISLEDIIITQYEVEEN